MKSEANRRKEAKVYKRHCLLQTEKETENLYIDI